MKPKFFEWQIILYNLLCLSKAFSTVKLVVFGFNCYLAKSENLVEALQNLNECTDVRRVFQIPHIFLDYILSSTTRIFIFSQSLPIMMPWCIILDRSHFLPRSALPTISLNCNLIIIIITLYPAANQIVTLAKNSCQVEETEKAQMWRKWRWNGIRMDL